MSEGDIKKTLIKEILREDYDYIIRVEEIEREGMPKVIIKSGYTLDGKHIGDLKMTKFICEKLGIKKPEYKRSDSTICSIGFSEKDQKWYGWSHRAIFGFKIGDVVKKGDCTASSGLPIGFKARTLEDCKRMAIAFADSVS